MNPKILHFVQNDALVNVVTTLCRSTNECECLCRREASRSREKTAKCSCLLDKQGLF